MLKQFFMENVLIPVAYAKTDHLTNLLGRVNEHVINPLITLLFAVAFVQFTIGLFNFFKGKDNSDALEKGKKHILWGVIGMAIMVSVFGIMSFITTTLGIQYDAGDNIGKSGGDGNVSGLFKK